MFWKRHVLSQTIALYFADCEHNWRYKTKHNYRYSLERFMNHVGPEFGMTDITADVINGWIKADTPKYKASTVKKNFLHLKIMLEWCKDKGILKDNPGNSRVVRLPRPDKEAPPPELSYKDVQDFLNCLPLAARHISIVQFHTGCRIGELIRPKLPKQCKEFQPPRYDERNNNLIIPNTKTHTYRLVPITFNHGGTITSIIRRYTMPDRSVIFRSGERIADYEYYYPRAREAWNDLGFTDIHAVTHIARKTYIDKLIEDGRDIREVQHCVGHEKIETTAKYASAVSVEKRRAAMDVFHFSDGVEIGDLNAL